jgi:hypothetical protein
LSFRFDEAAARHAYSTTSTAAQNAAWKNLIDYSFVTPPDDQGWRTLHPRMREALRKRLADPQKSGGTGQGHEQWRSYWQSRAERDTDDFAALAWYHSWCLEPEAAGPAWGEMAQRARSGLPANMALHYSLLSWWLPTDVEVSAGASSKEPAALIVLGMELCQASLGSRVQNLKRAISCYQTALRVCTETRFPKQWALAQNGLGNAYAKLPTGDRAQNLSVPAYTV